MILARDIMTRTVVTVSMEMDLQSAALVFATHGISGAPVVDSDRMLVGVISGRDIVRHTARLLVDAAPTGARFTRDELTTLAELRHDFESQRGAQLKIMDIMTPYAVSASEETPAVELAQIMCREKVHRVLILDEGRLTGIVSSMDIVRAVANSPLGNVTRESTLARRELRRAVKRDDKPAKNGAKPAMKNGGKNGAKNGGKNGGKYGAKNGGKSAKPAAKSKRPAPKKPAPKKPAPKKPLKKKNGRR